MSVEDEETATRVRQREPKSTSKASATDRLVRAWFSGFSVATFFYAILWLIVARGSGTTSVLVGSIWPRKKAAHDNSTLGFGQILVLHDSQHESVFQRKAFDLAATDANITYTYIDAPRGVHAHTALVGGTSDHHPVRNEAVPPQWHTYVLALNTAANGDAASSLIISEDADWDVHLRDQMRYITSSLQLCKEWRTEAEQIRRHGSDEYSRTSSYCRGPGHCKRSTTSGHPDYPRTYPGCADDELLLRLIEGPNIDVAWLANCHDKADSIRGGTDQKFNFLTGNHKDSRAPQRENKRYQMPKPGRADAAPARLPSKISTTACPLAFAVSRDGARKMLAHLLRSDPMMPMKDTLTDFCKTPHAFCSDVRPALFRKYKGCKSRGGTRGMQYNGRERSDRLCMEEAASLELDGISARWKAAKDMMRIELREVMRRKAAKEIEEEELEGQLELNPKVEVEEKERTQQQQEL
jgi:hypothetical protein